MAYEIWASSQIALETEAATCEELRIARQSKTTEVQSTSHMPFEALRVLAAWGGSGPLRTFLSGGRGLIQRSKVDNDVAATMRI